MLFRCALLIALVASASAWQPKRCTILAAEKLHSAVDKCKPESNDFCFKKARKGVKKFAKKMTNKDCPAATVAALTSAYEFLMSEGPRCHLGTLNPCDSDLTCFSPLEVVANAAGTSISGSPGMCLPTCTTGTYGSCAVGSFCHATGELEGSPGVCISRRNAKFVGQGEKCMPTVYPPTRCSVGYTCQGSGGLKPGLYGSSGTCQLPLSTVGGNCNTNNPPRKCAAGLTCTQPSSGLLGASGTCQLPLSTVGGECNTNNPPRKCAAGLTCKQPKFAGLGASGTCQLPLSTVGGECNTNNPPLKCVPGLTCKQPSSGLLGASGTCQLPPVGSKTPKTPP